ncbi:hypothetical protein Cgig2_019359 [Carnegiea gigantea]|uniref:Uncharacterized protein n=1 Tax=Carnegiea gigantea TaxID=171969 RepID=A0A9Q1GLL1_9CARY|nr:hypothetical protein Cgig2_019359 [Carnegiea gigantea]
MEESAKDQQPTLASGNGGRKSTLRYPLRSASKLKDQTAKSPDAPTVPSFTASKRGRPPSSLSKSVSALELSGKDKSSKPPRRLSIPTKSTVSPRRKPTNNITPISEARTKRTANGQEKSETPRSDVSKSSTRRKFSVLASASYWLQQIKLSESAAKHSISLGFFKLALEAGCEPLQLLREELKSYARRHNLGEHGEAVKGLFEGYEILETMEQLQVSETYSHVPEDATTLSDEGVQSTTSTTGTRKLKPKSLNTDSQASSAKGSSKKENAPTQRTASAVKTRASENRNPVNRRLVTESGVNNIRKKVQKTGKQESNNEGDKNKDEESIVKGVETKPSEVEPTLEGDKENMEVPLVAEITATGEN